MPVTKIKKTVKKAAAPLLSREQHREAAQQLFATMHHSKELEQACAKAHHPHAAEIHIINSAVREVAQNFISYALKDYGITFVSQTYVRNGHVVGNAIGPVAQQAEKQWLDAYLKAKNG